MVCLGFLSRGICIQEGDLHSGGGSAQGGLPRGVCLEGGGLHPVGSAPSGLPKTGVKTLPSRNFLCGW